MSIVSTGASGQLGRRVAGFVLEQTSDGLVEHAGMPRAGL
jgi:hypothetical protein